MSGPDDRRPMGDQDRQPTADDGSQTGAGAVHDAAETRPLAIRDATPPEMSLGRRIRQPRTIISILVPIFVLVLLAVSLPGFKLDKLPGLILAANPGLLLAAFLVYYATFPLRGLRWRLILRGAGHSVSLRDSTEIIFISWLVNCVVPAKLGDVYRAWLLRANFAVSLSRTLGTVFIERIFDLFVIVLMGLAAGFWSFRSGMPREVQIIFVLGFIVVVLLALALFTLRNFGRRLLDVLPVPVRLVELYERFEEGVFGIGGRQIPIVGIITVAIWVAESLRLYLVVLALGFPDLRIGLSGVTFVALAGSLLTAIPLTPAGLGFVEGAVIGLLTAVYLVPETDALAITVVDRAISILTVIIIGSIVYVLSPKTKGGATGAPVAEETARAVGAPVRDGEPI